MLDFWGSWCGPCIGEFPYLKQLYADFRSRGLEIIGIDSRDSAEAAKKCIAEQGLNWVQATSESTTDLVEKQLRIDSYPTLVLLDRERRVVTIGRRARKRTCGGTWRVSNLAAQLTLSSNRAAVPVRMPAMP